MIGEADAIPNKTPYESFILERMRGAAAAGAGDVEAVAKAFDAVIASGKLGNDEQLKTMQAVAGSYYRAKDYSKAINWAQRYQKAGGADASVNVLVLQSYYLNGDYANAAHERRLSLPPTRRPAERRPRSSCSSWPAAT